MFWIQAQGSARTRFLNEKQLISSQSTQMCCLIWKAEQKINSNVTFQKQWWSVLVPPISDKSSEALDWKNWACTRAVWQEACKAVSFVAWPLTSMAHLCRETFAAEGQEGHWEEFESEQHPSDMKFGLLRFLTSQRGCVGIWESQEGNILQQCRSSARVREFNHQKLLWFESCPAQAECWRVCVWWSLWWLPRRTSCCRCSLWQWLQWGDRAFVTMPVLQAGRNSPSNGAKTCQAGRTG